MVSRELWTVASGEHTDRRKLESDERARWHSQYHGRELHKSIVHVNYYCVSFERTGLKRLSDWELEKLGGAPGIGNRKTGKPRKMSKWPGAKMIGKSQKPHP